VLTLQGYCRGIILWPFQVSPQDRLQRPTVRAGDVVVPLIAELECRLDARESFDGRCRTDDHHPVAGKRRGSFDGQLDRITLRSGQEDGPACFREQRWQRRRRQEQPRPHQIRRVQRMGHAAGEDLRVLTAAVSQVRQTDEDHRIHSGSAGDRENIDAHW